MRTRVKIDFNKELYNYMIEELKNYAEIMEDKNAEKLINTIEKVREARQGRGWRRTCTNTAFPKRHKRANRNTVNRSVNFG